MDELRRNMDTEKHTINTFCQGMQEAMSKTHAAMIMEVQRQYDSKDRVYRSQLLLLGIGILVQERVETINMNYFRNCYACPSTASGLVYHLHSCR